MRQKRFPIRTADGLTFYKQTVLDDTHIRSVLEKCFDWCGLGIYRVFGSDPTHIYSTTPARNHSNSIYLTRLRGFWKCYSPT
ncbi:hypothetical protein F1880_008445 [Penicillium rolfsii]|nr:hypothetical protein F1880_008445 [Penicillium rolfsii]